MLTDENRLSDDVLLKAGFWLYCWKYADEFERHGGNFGPGAQLDYCIDPPPDENLLPIMKGYEEQLAKGWGKPPSEIFSEMGLQSESELSDALYYTLISVQGHGMDLRDKFKEAIGVYEEKHGALKIRPYYDELNALDDLAWSYLEKPDEEYAVVETATGEILEGHFWHEEAAEDWLREWGSEDERHKYSVKLIDD